MRRDKMSKIERMSRVSLLRRRIMLSRQNRQIKSDSQKEIKKLTNGERYD